MGSGRAKWSNFYSLEKHSQIHNTMGMINYNPAITYHIQNKILSQMVCKQFAEEGF